MKLEFAERVKTLRQEANLTQEQLAGILGTTQRKVSYWESGRIEPDLSSLWILADYFDVFVDYLLGRKDI